MFNNLRHARRFVTFLLLATLFWASLAVSPATAQKVVFAFRNLDGRRVAAGDFRGKVVVLAFGASWLPLSRAQVQGVQQLANEFGGRGVEVFWVSTDSEQAKSKNFASDEQLRSFATKNNLRINILRDPDGAISKGLGVDQLPTIVIFDKQGNVSGAPIGGLDPQGNLVEKLKPRIEGLL